MGTEYIEETGNGQIVLLAALILNSLLAAKYKMLLLFFSYIDVCS